jgi:hypothetical protein
MLFSSVILVYNVTQLFSITTFKYTTSSLSFDKKDVEVDREDSLAPNSSELVLFSYMIDVFLDAQSYAGHLVAQQENILLPGGRGNIGYSVAVMLHLHLSKKGKCSDYKVWHPISLGHLPWKLRCCLVLEMKTCFVWDVKFRLFQI